MTSGLHKATYSWPKALKSATLSTAMVGMIGLCQLAANTKDSASYIGIYKWLGGPSCWDAQCCCYSLLHSKFFCHSYMHRVYYTHIRMYGVCKYILRFVAVTGAQPHQLSYLTHYPKCPTSSTVLVRIRLGEVTEAGKVLLVAWLSSFMIVRSPTQIRYIFILLLHDRSHNA